MLPDNVPSTLPVTNVMLNPDANARSPLVDYELGGVAIGDPSQGLQAITWMCYLADNSSDVMLKPGDGSPVFFASIANVTEIALAFDQNMRPMIAYETSGSIALRWYDPVLSGYTTTVFGAGRNPRLTLDDKRTFNLNNSDVILAYIRGDGLYYRQQRDRFAVERLLETGMSSLSLVAVGMNRSWRLQFDLV